MLDCLVISMLCHITQIEDLHSYLFLSRLTPYNCYVTTIHVCCEPITLLSVWIVFASKRYVLNTRSSFKFWIALLRSKLLTLHSIVCCRIGLFVLQCSLLTGQSSEEFVLGSGLAKYLVHGTCTTHQVIRIGYVGPLVRIERKSGSKLSAQLLEAR